MTYSFSSEQPDEAVSGAFGCVGYQARACGLGLDTLLLHSSREAFDHLPV